MTKRNSSIATLPDNIKQGIENRLKDLHTSMPGIIESFDPVTQTASVQPAVRRIFIENEKLVPRDLPLLINVLVIFPRGGGFSLTFPVAKGDECLLTFAERSFDNWHKFGEVRDPGARRFHSLSDATAYVGISSLPNKIPNYDPVNTQLKKDDGSASLSINADSSISLDANSDINVTSQANIVAQCVTLSATASGSAEITAPTITLNGNVVINGSLSQGAGGASATLSGGLAVTGTMTSNGKDVSDTHGHAQGNDSAGDTQTNISGVL
jgi:phage baseplate assembly protein gpV